MTETNAAAADLAAVSNTPDDTPCVAVYLRDETGAEHEVLMYAADWQIAEAFAQDWRIVSLYDTLQVVSSSGAAVRSYLRQPRSWVLHLSRLLMKPDRSERVRFLDGDALNLKRDNLVVRPKGARLHEAPPRERKLTKREERLEAIVAGAFAGRDAEPNAIVGGAA